MKTVLTFLFVTVAKIQHFDTVK